MLILHQQASGIDTGGNAEDLHGGAQAHVHSMRRNPEAARNVLRCHVVIDKAQAIALAIGELIKGD